MERGPVPLPCEHPPVSEATREELVAGDLYDTHRKRQ